MADGRSVDDPLSELVSHAQQGDRAAFEELVRRTHGQAYNLAYQMLLNRQEAEDLTQEAYLRVWGGLPDFRGDSRFSTWLFRIVANACANRRRQLRRQPEPLPDAAQLERIPAIQDDPDTLAVTRDRNARLWEAIRRLPTRYRLVLSLFYQGQLSYNEVAEALSLPLGTVKAQLNRARQSLARALRKDNDENV